MPLLEDIPQTTIDPVATPAIDPSVAPATAPALGSSTPAEVVDYTATTGSVTPDATVSGQMNQLLADNSQFMQLNRSQAQDYANRRGMLNSSLAGTAGQAAAIQTSLPIAQQDASTNFQQNLTNQGAQNAAAAQNAQLGTNVNLANAGAENQFTMMQGELDAQRLQLWEQHYQSMDQVNNEYARRMEELQARFGADFDLQELKNQGALDLQALKNNADQWQLTANAFGSYLNSHMSVQDAMLTEIQRVQQMEGLSAEQKQEALVEIQQRYADAFAFVDQIFEGVADDWSWDFMMSTGATDPTGGTP